MPALELGDIWEPDGRYWAWITVQSVMAWPSDENARKAYVASQAAYTLGDFPQWFNQNQPGPKQANSAQRKEWTKARQVIKKESTRKFNQAGDFKSVAFSPGLTNQNKQLEKMAPDWFAAGLVLNLVWSMHAHHADLRGGASVKKALHILENIKLPMTPRNSTYLLNAWSTYRPVAHLCAATAVFFFMAAEAVNRPDTISVEVKRMFSEEFDVFLAIADAYQQFGLTYKPQHGTGRTILDSSQTWLLPEKKQWESAPYVPSPLDARLLKLARAYKAPIPGS